MVNFIFQIFQILIFHFSDPSFPQRSLKLTHTETSFRQHCKCMHLYLFARQFADSLVQSYCWPVVQTSQIKRQSSHSIQPGHPADHDYHIQCIGSNCEYFLCDFQSRLNENSDPSFDQKAYFISFTSLSFYICLNKTCLIPC